MYEFLLVAITSMQTSYGDHVAFERFEEKRECQAVAKFINDNTNNSRFMCLAVKKHEPKGSE